MRSPLALVVVVAGLATGCQSDEPESAPSATVAAAPTTPTTSSSVAPPSAEAEVEAAYLKSWEVYADALLRLDGSRFPEVYIGDALALRTEELADLVEANTPVRIDVEHDYEIVVAEGGNEALVKDAFLNHSVLLDGESGEPIEADPKSTARQNYRMRRAAKTWHIEHVTTLS